MRLVPTPGGFADNPFQPTQLPNLLAWWRADNATTQNAAQLSFASGQYFSLSGATFTDGLTKLTLAGFVLLNDSTKTTNGIVAKWSAGQAQFQVGLNNGTLKVAIANGVGDTGSNSWSIAGLTYSGYQLHFVIVYDGSQAPSARIKVFLNGGLDLTGSGTVAGVIPTSLTTSAADLTLGQDGGGVNFLDGKLGRWRFFPGVALTSSQAETLHNYGRGWTAATFATSGLPTPAHGWDFLDTSGNAVHGWGGANLTNHNAVAYVSAGMTITDGSGNGNDAAGVLNGPTLVANGMNGHPVARFVQGNKPWLGVGLVSGADKPANWSVYALFAPNTASAAKQSTLFGTFNFQASDKRVWGITILHDGLSIGGAPDGSFGFGFGDETLYSYGNTAGGLLVANVPCHITGVYTDGNAAVDAWIGGAASPLNLIAGSTATHCTGAAYPGALGASTDIPLGFDNWGDFDLAEFAVYGVNHNTAQRQAMEAYQKAWGGTTA